MACYHPLHGFVIGQNKNGKQHLVVKSGSVFSYKTSTGLITDYIEVPCGKCIGCRLDYSRKWADRMVLESKQYPKDECWFITLTYDDEHIGHLARTYDKAKVDTGEIFDGTAYSLSKDDIQRFVKRLRKNSGQKFRYFLCGEYGEKGHRPHYHLCLFGLKLDDLTVETTKEHKDGHRYTYYSSKLISDAWKDKRNYGENTEQNGFITIAPFSWHTAGYVARYVTKKINKNIDNIYELTGIEKEFVLMSRNPGIGSQYYEQHKDQMFESVDHYIGAGQKLSSIRYFNEKYMLDNEKQMMYIKDVRRKNIEAFVNSRLNQTSRSLSETREIDERTKLEKAKSLRREMFER